jgi:pimeloyl-ACP methyl ester carboxylesterase
VNGSENERLSYQFALEAARAAGDEAAVKNLVSLGPPENGRYKGGFKGLMAQRKVMMKHGGYSLRKDKRGMFDSFVKPMMLSGEYSFIDFIGLVLGYKYVLKAMWDHVAETDLAKTCPHFEMPYFIFDGRLDHNTPASLVEGYFQAISAPRKELIWFENSGHNPMTDEPEAFKSALRKKLIEVAEEERNKGVVL